MKPNRIFLLSLLVVLAAAITVAGAARPVTAQTAPPTQSAAFPPSDGKPQELKVYNFATYIADDTIANFEQQFNVKVTYETFAKADELFAKMKAGNPGYDVIVAPDYMISQLNTLGLLLPLDFTNIPNFDKNVDPSFKDPSYDPGNAHSVPYQWGTMGIGYNKKHITTPITSFKQVFGPEFKGKVALINTSREQLAMILIALGLDPNTTNQDDLDQARDWMLDHKDAVALVHDADGQFRLLRGEIDVAIDWSGDMFQVMSGDATDSLAYIIPSEGTFRWTDNMAIPKGAANKPLAEAFINYVYDPAVAASISNFTQYGSPNRAAIDTKLIDASLLANPAIYPPPETVAKLKTLKDLGDKAALFDTTWQEILGGVLR